MSKPLTERILTLTKITTHPKKTILLKEGDINNHACMVITGLVRSYYLNEGKDITSRLMGGFHYYFLDKFLYPPARQ